MSTATLAVGARVAYDGEAWNVVDLAGSRATIEKAGGLSRSVAITRLLSPPNHLVVDDARAAEGLGQVFASLSQTERAQLADRLAHVREQIFLLVVGHELRHEVRAGLELGLGPK